MLGSVVKMVLFFFFFSSRRRHTRLQGDWSSDVCSSDLAVLIAAAVAFSRTYLSAHWLSDVVGGSLIGGGLALAVPEAFEVVRDRRRSRADGITAGGPPEGEDEVDAAGD